MADLPERLRKQAAWLESRSFAVLHGTIEREAAREIERLRAELAKVKADYQRYVDGVDAAEHAEIERLRGALTEIAAMVDDDHDMDMDELAIVCIATAKCALRGDSNVEGD